MTYAIFTYSNRFMLKALINFVIDHLKHFKSYPMEFEYRNKIYNYDQIIKIIDNRKKDIKTWTKKQKKKN